LALGGASAKLVLVLEFFVPRRVDKLLRDSTTLSVSETRRALSAGRVTLQTSVAPARLPQPDELVFESDVVRLDGSVVVPRADHKHAMLNKPRSVTSTARDPKGKADLSRWLEQMPRGMFPIGRLDRDTTGLLLFTSDGDLANAVLQPGHETDKQYWLWLDEHVPDDDPRLAAMHDGVELRGKRARAKSVEVLSRTDHFTELLVTLDEGQNRQIRRMCYALDFRLVQLHRRSVGPLRVGELPLGDWRLLDAQEVEALWAATGGRERVLTRKLSALRRFAAERRAGGAPHVRLEAWLQSRT